MAPTMANSPANATVATISANFRAWPAPAQPSIERHSCAVGRYVPPPTVPTIRFGKVTEAYTSFADVRSTRVSAVVASATHATSCPQAMKIAASALATLPCNPTAPVCAAPLTACLQARSIFEASVRQYLSTCFAGSTISALTFRPRAERNAMGVARLSPDIIDSTNHERGGVGMSLSRRAQMAWVESVTMFWPAASPVENSNSTYTVLPTMAAFTARSRQYPDVPAVTSRSVASCDGSQRANAPACERLANSKHGARPTCSSLQ